MKSKEKYDEDYFERGEELGISCYSKYRWLPTRTLVTVSEIIRRANIKRKDTILDYGCAKGYLVKAFRWLGYKAHGYDISKYATKNADPEIKKYIYTTIPKKPLKKYDIIICKDTAEHIPHHAIKKFLKNIYEINKKKAIFIIPLGNGRRYNIPRYEKDITHQIRENKKWWKEKIEEAGYQVSKLTDDLSKIKPNWNVPEGNIYIEAEKK